MSAVLLAACTEPPAPKTADAAPPAEKAPKRSKSERQAELLTKAESEMNAGKVEPAIAAYIDAEKLGPLPGSAAGKFAAALKQNGDAVLAGGEDIPRAMSNYIKAVTVAPETEGLAVALLDAAAKQDVEGRLYGEEVVGSYLDENKPELTEAATAVLAGFFKANAERLLPTKWTVQRVFKNIDRAQALAPDLAGLDDLRAKATEKLESELKEAIEIQEQLNKLQDKHPDKDSVETVAKRRKMTRDEIMAAVELVQLAEETRAKTLAKECGPKPSCGGLDGGCQGDETVFKDEVEVSNCSKPALVEGKCWVVQCDVKSERTGAHAGRYELNYKAVQGVPMPVSAERVGG